MYICISKIYSDSNQYTTQYAHSWILEFGLHVAVFLGIKFLKVAPLLWQASALKESFQEPCGEAGVANGASNGQGVTGCHA